MNSAVSSIEALCVRVTLTIAFLLAFALVSTDGRAAIIFVDGGEAASLLTECMFADDNKEASTPAGAYACCSKSLGYCVSCPANTSEPCEKTTYSTSGINPPVIEIISPALLGAASPHAEQDDPRDRHLNVLRNYLERNKASTGKSNTNYESKE